MTEYANFADLVEIVKDEGDFYWQERAKLEFATGLSALMNNKGISKAELAKRMKVSAAHITQSLRGDKNLQIETMVSMARALGGELHIRVSDQAHSVKFFTSIDGFKKPDFKGIPNQARIGTGTYNEKFVAVS